MTFDTLGLSAPILKAVSEKGYKQPSPIQAKAIPAILKGDDVMAAAQTGTGKTAGFTLPILEILSKGNRVRPKQVRTLILTPTRELAAQIDQNVCEYSKHLNLSSLVVYGGVKINPQINKLQQGIDILVATPGRLIDLYRQKAVRFDQVEVFVLDEADRMLDMGFIHDIRKVIAFLPKTRQNLMFSATFSNDIRDLAKGLINNPIEISVSPRNTTVEAIEQVVYPVDKKKKSALLIKLIFHNKWHQVLIFSRTKHGANKIATQLVKSGIPALAIHGNKSQNARTKALADFKKGDVQALVATDIASRGIDIDQLPYVINFDLPNIPEDYIHRIGRTGRAGKNGLAVSLVCSDEFNYLSDIENLIKNIIPRKTHEGYEPIHDLPKSILGKNTSPTKKKYPPKKGHQDGQRSNAKPKRRKPSGNNRFNNNSSNRNKNASQK